MKELAMVFLGGGLGSCCRFTLNKLLANFPLLPFGTLISNFLSCIVFGFFIVYGLHKTDLSQPIKLLILTGFCGGLSTFSTFSYETTELFKSSEIALAFCNILLNLSLSMIGLFIGMFIVKSLAL